MRRTYSKLSDKMKAMHLKIQFTIKQLLTYSLDSRKKDVRRGGRSEPRNKKVKSSTELTWSLTVHPVSTDLLHLRN